MILGSDKRNQEISGKFGLSDTTMLLRLDPDRNAIALLSLPRDLKVCIPGFGTDKLNAAYSLGGPKLTLQTVKQLTGLDVNHLVNVDFTGFARAVNAIGCVYVDVDHRYFHQNGPYSSSSDYAEINLQPGYQALCGFDALSFVALPPHRQRHRARGPPAGLPARGAGQGAHPSSLVEDRKKLIKIFTTYTSSDIDAADQMLQVLEAVLRSARGADQGDPLRGPPRSLLRHRHSPARSTRRSTSSSASRARPVRPGSTAKPDQTGHSRAGAGRHQGRRRPRRRRSKRSTRIWSTRPTASSLPQGIKARKLKVPVYYPTQLEAGSDYAQKPRVYKINGKGDQSPPHSRARRLQVGLLTTDDRRLLRVHGHALEGPADPRQPEPTRRRSATATYKLYYDGDRLRMVAWQTDQGSFWVSNSFIETVPNADMLKIAQSFRQLPGT